MTQDTPRAAEPSVVELEFTLDGSDFFLATISETTGCELELDTLVPRSDGTVLEFLTTRGIDPSGTRERLLESPGIKEVRLLEASDDEALFELISESRIATALADEEAFLNRITASGGEGRLVAEVPSHIDVSNVIASFLTEYPGAELVARRETNRHAPSISEAGGSRTLLADLTDKQVRALRVAHANGYFEFPRRHKAAEIAEKLGVSTPTFSQHLRVAERKLLDQVF